MKSIFLTAFLTLSPLLSPSLLVAAHGIVEDITIAGKKYPGPVARESGRTDASGVVRQVQSKTPVTSVDSPFLVCGQNAAPASQSADVNPGEEVLFKWSNGWPHIVGPMLTYMASCGGSCTNFDASQARWFKISELGQRPGSKEWYQADIAKNLPARATIPSNLAPGNYLIRHEIIALHNAASPGGAEMYPSCSQLRVLGSGTGRPSDNELVRFPGAYKQDEAGLYVPEIYQPGFTYTMPGPRVAALAGGSGGGAPAPPAPPAPTPAPPAPEPSKPVEDDIRGPINAAPIPNTSITVSPPATTSPATSPSAPKPSTIRRCKNRGNALQRAEKRKRAAEAAAAASSPSPAVPTPPSVVPTVEKRSGGVHVGHVSHVGGSFARRHHGKAMRRLAAQHSH